MKKQIFVIICIFLSAFSYSQSIFNKLEDLDDVKSFVLTKDAFELLKKFPDAKSEDMEVFNSAKGLEELKVFSTENTAIASQMENLVNSAVKSGGLTQLMRAKDQGSRVKIFIKATSNKDLVSEVLMFVKDKDSTNGKLNSTIVSLTGQIDVNKLSKIADGYSK
ncbi:DUF4252 domain-containing protein [Tenacibaculum sp. UWU-22]|uniref:DUF4252 domain-containing protein n=1 Tax=Tenacibaculum sp. UWU-22 TaxID=3234187 RepID=UPI0034DB17BA